MKSRKIPTRNILPLLFASRAAGGWGAARPLAPWIGAAWATSAYPGPGAALALALPGGGQRLLFCAHAGAYTQDVAFFSDDVGRSFNVSASTPHDAEHSALAGMDECALAQLGNGSVLMVLRNFGG